MRKAAIALLSAVVAGLLMVPGGVSAGPTMKIACQDKLGDLGPHYDAAAADTDIFWPDHTPLTKVGYFDMTSFWLSYSSKEKTYTFGMELAKALPTPGSSLPTGFKMVKWLMWIDAEPWNPKYNPGAPCLFTIQLRYDGSDYVAELAEGSGWGPAVATLPFVVDGSALKMQFSAASIGNLESFWFLPCTVVQWSLQPYSGYWDLDASDPGAAPGQVWWDIPWPPA